MTALEVLHHHRVAIAGRVADEVTGKPISDTEVMLTKMPTEFARTLELASLRYGNLWASMVERPDRTRSRADGIFHFIDLPVGEYTVRASVPGLGKRYGAVEQPATVSNDEQTKFTFVNLAVPPTTVRGKVTGPGRKTGVVMAEVRVKGSGERVFSDAQGAYTLTGIEPGKRTILVYAQGYKVAVLPVTLVRPGDVQTINVSLVREPG